ncbi:MAG: 16S rRNA (uracil(1498)-N(3))-methyltransferase, partial [Bacteroidetes bacterium]|nr:16S rRNA (uracil(1498)-N(3))-methyltransferase [Bacteroidota bacterium]
EGDFTQEEIQLAVQNGFEGVTLGKKTLRTETAMVAACLILNLKNS